MVDGSKWARSLRMLRTTVRAGEDGVARGWHMGKAQVVGTPCCALRECRPFQGTSTWTTLGTLQLHGGGESRRHVGR